MEQAIATNIVNEINEAHRAAKAAAGTALNYAMEAGRLLEQAKTSVRHGEWLPWLAENCPEISERTAQQYMRLHTHRLAIESNPQRDAHLSVRTATKLLEQPKRPQTDADTDADTDTIETYLPPAGKHRVWFALNRRVGVVVTPSPDPKYHFVTWFEPDTSDGLSIAGLKRAIRADRAALIAKEQVRVLGDVEWVQDHNECPFSGSTAPWEYNQLLFHSKEAYLADRFRPNS